MKRRPVSAIAIIVMLAFVFVLAWLAAACRLPENSARQGSVGAIVDEAFAALLPATSEAMLSFAADRQKNRPAAAKNDAAQAMPSPTMPASPVALGNIDAAIEKLLKAWQGGSQTEAKPESENKGGAAAATAAAAAPGTAAMPAAAHSSPAPAGSTAAPRAAAPAAVVPAPGAAESAPSFPPAAILASPLAAAKLIEKNIGAVKPPPLLVVPFAESFGIKEQPRVVALGYDYKTVYAAMGKKAARLLPKAKSDEAQAVCGIVFQSNFMRSAEALEAFAAAFEAEAGKERLVVQVLERSAGEVDAFGATKQAIAALMENAEKKGRPAVIVLAVDNSSAAEEAAGGARDRIFMADQSAWGTAKPAPGLFRYRIRGREAALGRAAVEAARSIAAGRSPAPAPEKVPLRLEGSFGRIF